jgi:mRNA interferase MazF
VKRGEVWWLHRPDRKPRPACILTRDEAIPALRRLIVVTATTKVRGIEAEVELDESDGMPQPCALTLDNVLTVRKVLLTDCITSLPASRVHEICEALRFATGC